MSDGVQRLEERLAEQLESAETPGATEAAVSVVLDLLPKQSIADRALADVVVGCVAAMRAAGAGPAGQGAAAAVCVEAFRAAQAGAGGWGPREEVMSLVRDALLESAMPEAGGDAALTPELAEAASRFLATTLFSQWELHRAVLGDAAGLPAREVEVEQRVVDRPRRPPPLAEATRQGVAEAGAEATEEGKEEEEDE